MKTGYAIPPNLDVYDPRVEQLRAQRQAIYESSVRELFGGAPFRDREGRRLDLRLSPPQRNELFRRAFAIGTGVQQKHGWVGEGSQTATPKAIASSRERYANVDHLLRNRQDYEESLALNRKSGFFRALVEPGARSLIHTVWPMPFGCLTPVAFHSASEAQAAAATLNARPPLPWASPGRAYKKADVDYWLPPQSIWSV